MPKNKDTKREEAKQRNEARAKRTTADQLALLTHRFGPDSAKRERARLTRGVKQ